MWYIILFSLVMVIIASGFVLDFLKRKRVSENNKKDSSFGLNTEKLKEKEIAKEQSMATDITSGLTYQGKRSNLGKLRAYRMVLISLFIIFTIGLLAALNAYFITGTDNSPRTIRGIMVAIIILPGLFKLIQTCSRGINLWKNGLGTDSRFLKEKKTTRIVFLFLVLIILIVILILSI
jgi:hypothetical protein